MTIPQVIGGPQQMQGVTGGHGEDGFRFGTNLDLLLLRFIEEAIAILEDCTTGQPQKHHLPRVTGKAMTATLTVLSG
jgi:hypothetical protein